MQAEVLVLGDQKVARPVVDQLGLKARYAETVEKTRTLASLLRAGNYVAVIDVANRADGWTIARSLRDRRGDCHFQIVVLDHGSQGFGDYFVHKDGKEETPRNLARMLGSLLGLTRKQVAKVGS